MAEKERDTIFQNTTMKSDQKYLVLDYETYSDCDIQTAGGFEYSRHPSTEIICAGFKLATKDKLIEAPTHLWIPSEPSQAFSILLKALLDPGIILVAHNAFFEQVITKHVFARYMKSKPYLANIPIERWICTASLARAMGLPGKLEMVGHALGLGTKKDMEGHRLMLKLSQPRMPTKNNPLLRHEDLLEHIRLYEYCLTDVQTEAELFVRLKPLHEKERKIWVLNQETNLTGFSVDRQLVLSALSLIENETKRLDQKFRQIASNYSRELISARQTKAFLNVLQQNGVCLNGKPIPNLQAQTIQEVLDSNECNLEMEELLEIRQQTSKSSTAKYVAFEARSRSDSRARDNTIYYGAHTGREAGTGLQPQNLFKTLFPQKQLELGLELMKLKDVGLIEAMFDHPMKLYASALRSCIVASPGKCLLVGDFAGIELRVLFWAAEHKKGLHSLNQGLDLYCEMASYIFKRPANDIKEGYKAGDKTSLFQRELGKRVVLGAGFGIGVNGVKFQATAARDGIQISLEAASAAVQAYRQLHRPVPAFWDAIEKAAKLAVANPGKRYRITQFIWCLEGDFLTCELPMGRKIHYPYPKLKTVKTMYGLNQVLSYETINSKTKKWGEETTWGGKLTENVVQAVARDLLKEALLRMRESGRLTPILEVHDEIVCEGSRDDLEFFLNLMSEVPQWAKGLPIKVEGWAEERYRK